MARRKRAAAEPLPAGLTPEVLDQLVAGVQTAALAYLRSKADAGAVRAQVERAQRMGVTGVPFFIFAGRYGIGGAQPPEVLLDALRRTLLPPNP